MLNYAGEEHRAEASLVSGDKEADHRELSQVDT